MVQRAASPSRAAAGPLEQRRCAGLDLPPGKARCGRCNASLGQIESDLAAAEALAQTALRVVLEEGSPQASRPSASLWRSSSPRRWRARKRLEAGIERLREAVLKALASGKVVFPE